MSTTYEVIDMVAAMGMGAPGTEDRDVEDERFFKGVWRCENGIPVALIGEDGGEPEDQTLGRAWKWVAPALMAAYERGRRDV